MSIDTGEGARLTVDMGEIENLVGTEFGPGRWLSIEQDRIDAFATATGDHQWIHVDVDRAANGPFGATIAHGYLTLSMVPQLLEEILEVTGRSSGVNYGVDRVRFITPVREGQRIRMRGTILDVAPRAGGIQYRLGITIDLEGSDKPAVAGECIVLAFP